MKSINNSLVVIVALVAIFVGSVSFHKAQATTDVCFCHNLNNNPITICTDNEGLISGHMGHVANESDSLGECSEETIPTATPTPTDNQEDPRVTPTPTPAGNIIEDNIFDVCIPFITNCVTPTVTPTPTEEVRVTPTPTVTPDPTAVPVGGSSNNPSTSSSSSSPSTGGQELGTTTLAKTGVFEDRLAHF